MLRSLLFVLLIPLLLYIGVVFMMWAMQSRLVYFPTREINVDPGVLGLAFDEISLETADGETLHGWFVATDPTQPVILFLHGNAGNVSHRIDSLRLLHELKANVLLIDYRGYGQSTGRPSEQGTYADAASAWDYLTSVRGFDASAVIIFGRSLGGAVAVWLASQQNAGALVMESTFTSIADLGSESYGWLPVRSLTRIHYDSQSRLRQIATPSVVLHSKNDDIIGFEHGKKLFAAAKNPVEFVALTGDHNSGFLSSGEIYVNAWKRVLQRKRCIEAIYLRRKHIFNAETGIDQIMSSRTG